MAVLLAMGILLISCRSQTPPPCTELRYADLSEVEAFAADDQAVFQFPLDDTSITATPYHTHFCERSRYETGYKFHAAEDYFHPPGTPVYAIADGEISFSGPMGGYGWLIIIDHPAVNLYSLYGHLSPSRWYKTPGPVTKGELIAYLGDPDENGGTPKQPLEPHLHLGVRAGQRADYSGYGEWRWMAGWIHLCPADIGWLQPSMVITRQQIPSGGFQPPTGNFFEKWAAEFLLGSIYLIGATSLLIFTPLRTKPFFLVGGGGVLLLAAWIFAAKAIYLSRFLIVLGPLLAGVGVLIFYIRRTTAFRQS